MCRSIQSSRLGALTLYIYTLPVMATVLRPTSPLDTQYLSAQATIFAHRGKALLIVRALFFIQHPNGEVAEWSKALPC